MITLICGLPNAGKTTYSSQFTNVVHRDECPHPQYITFPQMVAETKGDVYAEGVYNTKITRKTFLNTVEHRHERTVCIWLDTPLDVCIERENNGRKRGEYLVRREAEHFEPPTYDEGWDEIIVIRNCYGRYS